MSDLPRYWDTMDVPALWEALNNPARFLEAPNSVNDAVVWSLIHNRGWDKDKRRANQQRIAELSPRQFHQLIAALKRHHCDPAILAEIESYA